MNKVIKRKKKRIYTLTGQYLQILKLDYSRADSIHYCT